MWSWFCNKNSYDWIFTSILDALIILTIYIMYKSKISLDNLKKILTCKKILREIEDDIDKESNYC